MKPFNQLSLEENNALLKFPDYISLLAAYSDDSLDETEKKTAIKFVHTKTFSCDPLLTEFYREAEKVFEDNIDQIEKELTGEKTSREVAIKKELFNLEKIASKLGKKYALVMHRSILSFKEHVSRAHHNVLVDFVFPLSIPGLNE